MCEPTQIGGYNYIERHISPQIVEFYVRNPQGHRIVRIYLGPYPSIVAYNESNSQRTAATLYLKEIESLIERAKQITQRK